MINFDNSRPTKFAYYILSNKTTIRMTAKVFGVSKSTVHYDLSTKLEFINYKLYQQVQKLLKENFRLKHIHGGQATKIKYEKLKQEINKNDEFELLI